MTASHTKKQHNKTLGFTAWAVHLLLLALMLMLAVWAARWGWAEVLVAEPRNVMDRWKTGQVMPADEELDRLGKLLERAQSLNSKNADIAFDQGRFAEWLASQHPLWSKEAQSRREVAIGYFREAISLRPSWGLAWINLANSLVLNQQLYSGGMDALEKAAVLAPLESDVQQRVVWLGLSQWKHADDDLRVRLKNILESILNVRSYVVVKAIADFRLEKELGNLLVSDEDQELLNKMLAKRKYISSRKR
ncbi:MAG: hypothetical protein L3J26_07030 [Candidatus Polarisedimenticolaceae bacterium]|nr:hypothetical protein [Candidatus Polarisedimenticolaceae bacterium]